MHQIKGIIQIRSTLFVCALLIYLIALSANAVAASVMTGIDVLKVYVIIMQECGRDLAEIIQQAPPLYKTDNIG